MNTAPLEILKEIFHSARELPSRERAAFLTEACGGDEQLRVEIEALLHSDRAAENFIADPPARLVADAFGASPDPSEAGRKIGQYKLLKCIGTGGMGAVYLAERADQQFEMQVASTNDRFLLRSNTRTSPVCSTAELPTTVCPTSSWSTSKAIESIVTPRNISFR